MYRCFVSLQVGGLHTAFHRGETRLGEVSLQQVPEVEEEQEDPKAKAKVEDEDENMCTPI